MKYTCKSIGLNIVIGDKLILQLCALGQKHYPKEYGGLLVGRYVDSNKTLIVEETIQPKQFKSSSSTFERGVKGLDSALTDFFNRSPSLIYVGEWHTHPNGAPIPSATDRSALQAIVQHHEVFIENPILLIIGVAKYGFDIGFHVLYRGQIYTYEIEHMEDTYN